MKQIPKVVVTDISNRPYYFQWFIYGFMLLSRNRQIDLSFKVPFLQKLQLSHFGALVYKALNKLINVFKGSSFEDKSKALFYGYIECDGKTKRFCIDSADSPFMFMGKALAEVDYYFKMQCPKEFDDKGFPLGNIRVPYIDYEYQDGSPISSKQRGVRKLCPEVFEYNSKIKPLLVAIRRMSFSCSFNELDKNYKKLVSSREVKTLGKAMCYFGNALGPVPSNSTDGVDYDWESDIVANYSDLINHPNEKRAKVASIMQKLGEGYDARVINLANSDTGNSSRRDDLVIPLNVFSEHVAKFSYNVNISGYRMSIPNRFMDSFVCGTAIATDNLYVKWYMPFEDEVVELGDMGYLPDNEVDYDKVSERLKNLKTVSKQIVVDKYEKYWAPIKCAKYIVNTIIK